jgi:hypothetical protein
VLPKRRPSTLKYAVGLVMKTVNVETETYPFIKIKRKKCVIVSWNVVSLSTGNLPRPLYTVLLLNSIGKPQLSKTYDQGKVNGLPVMTIS